MSTRRRASRTALWILQGLPRRALPLRGRVQTRDPNVRAGAVLALPGVFLKFIGVCEALGALGLVLPGSVPRARQPDATRLRPRGSS